MLTIGEAAAEKGVHIQSVWRAIKDERLPATRKGKFWLIARRDLDAWQPIGHRPKKNQE